MKELLFPLLFALNLTSATDATPPSPARTAQKPILTIPKAMGGAIWVHFFFGNVGDTATINGYTELSDLPSLQKSVLPAGDLEVRIWV